MLDGHSKKALRLLQSGLLIIAAVAGSSLAESQLDPPAVQVQKDSFEVATVRPSLSGSANEDWASGGDRVTIRGYSLRKLVKAAFNLKSDAQIVGGPAWLDKKHFDISAKIEDEQVSSSNAPSSGRRGETEVQSMLQTLLVERFHLSVEQGKENLPIFALVMSGTKTKLIQDSAKPRSLSIRNGRMVSIANSMEDVAEGLSRMREVGDRIVIDRTGLVGTYDFGLNWTPDHGAGISEDAVYPGLFTALHEQLGLRLKAAKGEVPVIKVLAAEIPRFD